jgi:hypothetical protein
LDHVEVCSGTQSPRRRWAGAQFDGDLTPVQALLVSLCEFGEYLVPSIFFRNLGPQLFGNFSGEFSIRDYSWVWFIKA